MKFFGVPVKSFNVEITNKCTLACPECARTGNPWVKENLSDLPLAVLQDVFPLKERKNLAGLRINLCGAYGDCIYHRNFHDVIRYLKEVGLALCVETNGSHRKPSWWETTCEILSADDAVTFSVDGLEETNHIYRVNARWDDIMTAMKFCAQRVTVNWKFIVFRHNEHQIDQARELAAEIGVSSLTFKKSARFKQHDPLAPVNGKYIGVVTSNRRQIKALATNGVSNDSLDERVSIRPKCLSGKDLAITALGYFFPCTTCQSSDTTSWFYENQEFFNLRKYSIEEILASPKWGELQNLWERTSTAPTSCLEYCGVHQDFEEQYSAESRPDRPNKPDDVVTVHFGLAV